MAINNNFYRTLNELTTLYTNGDTMSTVGIVDYDSFVDAGRVIADMEISQIQNGFLNNLMNKVQLTVDTFRSYEPLLMDMYKGSTEGGIVEILSHTFYSVRQAPFINLQASSDDSMIDFVKPSIAARYYTDENAWQLPISRTDTEVRAAWRSPEAMDAFIQSILGDVVNSNNLHKEVCRINTINAMINDTVSTATRVTEINKTGRYIDLLAIYNSAYAGAGLTADNALQTPEFVRWAVSYINMFKKWMRQPSPNMNGAAITTFTPLRDQRTKISTLFDSAIERSLWNIYRTEGAMLSDYEVIPYWQNSKEADTVRVTPVSGVSSARSNVIAVLYDTYAVGEFTNLESVTSERNNKKLYTTYYYNYIMRYIRNENANFVVFTLGDRKS